MLIPFSLCPLGPYCVIYLVCVYFVCLCGISSLMYIITTKNSKKNFCVDCWLDLGQMDLEFRQHTYDKWLGQCQLLWNQVLAIWNFIWYIIENPFEFICNMIIVKLLLWTCDLWHLEIHLPLGQIWRRSWNF